MKVKVNERKLPWVKQKPKIPFEREHTNQEFHNSTRWRACSKTMLQLYPVCQVCDNAPAQVTDHVISIKPGGALLNPQNLMTMCHKCHNRKSGKEKHKKILIEAIQTEVGLIPKNKTDIIAILKK